MTTNTIDKPKFAGADYDPARDNLRLMKQHERIKYVMLSGKWRTLAEIASLTGDPPASISAQLRHLRKAEFGGYVIQREYVGEGLYIYRMADAA